MSMESIDGNGAQPRKSDIVKLSVGGRRFVTRAGTLTHNGSQENFFSSLLSGRFPAEVDEKGYIFIDRNPDYFAPILDYLRTGEWECPPGLSHRRLVEEAKYYGVLDSEDTIHIARLNPARGFSDDDIRRAQIYFFERKPPVGVVLPSADTLHSIKSLIFEKFRDTTISSISKRLCVIFFPSASRLSVAIAQAGILAQLRSIAPHCIDVNRVKFEFSNTLIADDNCYKFLSEANVRAALEADLWHTHQLSVVIKVIRIGLVLHRTALPPRLEWVPKWEPNSPLVTVDGFKISWKPSRDDEGSG